MPPKRTVPKVTDHRATPDNRYETNMAKIESERMSVFAVTKDEWVDDQLMVKIQSSSSVYNVKIAKKPTCECPAATFQGPICKHILYTLHFVLKTPEPLRWQHRFQTEQLVQMLRDVKIYPLPQEQVKADPTLTDGVEKPTAGSDCPLCYKDCGDGETTVCCTSCGHHTHRVCFNVWAKSEGDWGKKELAEYEAAKTAREKEAKAAAKAAAKAEKDAARAIAKAEKDEAKAEEKAAQKAERDIAKAEKAAQKAVEKEAQKTAKAEQKAAAKAEALALKAEKKAPTGSGNENASPKPARTTKGKKRTAGGGGRRAKKQKVASSDNEASD